MKTRIKIGLLIAPNVRSANPADLARAAGAHRFVITMLDAALRPENYQAELSRLASLYV